MTSHQRFCLILIKPSHYDDDGYVFQWWRSPVPSNSLAVLYGLALDCAHRKILGDNIDLEIHPIDETHTRVRPERVASMIEKAGNGMVMLGSVVDNEYGRNICQPADIGEKETQAPYLVVADADAVYSRAQAAGFEIVVDIKDEDYGGRGFSCRDPEGHLWNVGTYDPWAPGGS